MWSAGMRTMVEAGAARRRVLVVDDSADITESLSDVLQMLGHETRSAPDGPTALRLAAEFRPHVVLLDLGLPEMSGQEVARRLRESPGGAQLRIVALTGWADPAAAGSERESDFDAHVVKPVSLDLLRDLIGDARAGQTG